MSSESTMGKFKKINFYSKTPQFANFGTKQNTTVYAAIHNTSRRFAGSAN